LPPWPIRRQGAFYHNKRPRGKSLRTFSSGEGLPPFRQQVRVDWLRAPCGCFVSVWQRLAYCKRFSPRLGNCRESTASPGYPAMVSGQESHGSRISEMPQKAGISAAERISATATAAISSVGRCAIVQALSRGDELRRAIASNRAEERLAAALQHKGLRGSEHLTVNKTVDGQRSFGIRCYRHRLPITWLQVR